MTTRSVPARIRKFTLKDSGLTVHVMPERPADPVVEDTRQTFSRAHRALLEQHPELVGFALVGWSKNGTVGCAYQTPDKYSFAQNYALPGFVSEVLRNRITHVLGPWR